MHSVSTLCHMSSSGNTYPPNACALSGEDLHMGCSRSACVVLSAGLHVRGGHALPGRQRAMH